MCRRAEADPSILGCASSPVHVLGLCTGLLPATVAAAAKDTSELLRIAVEVVAISFRLGHETDVRSKRIEDGPGSWAYTIVGVAAAQCQEILDELHKTQVMSDRSLFEHDANCDREFQHISMSTYLCLLVPGQPSLDLRLPLQCYGHILQS